MGENWQELARDPNKKIAAIKLYREQTGAGLAAAKEAVEAYMRGAGIEVHTTSGVALIVGVLVIVAICGGLLWLFLRP